MLIYAIHSGDYRYRYVGLTTKTVEQRFDEHLAAAVVSASTPFYCWLYKHKSVAKVEILETCETLNDLGECERKWIAVLRSSSMHDLLNLTDGGIGCQGYRWTDEQKKKLKSRKKRGPITDEEIRRRNLTRKQRLESGEAVPYRMPQSRRNEIAAIQRAISADPVLAAERSRKISLKLKGRTLAEDHREKLSEVGRGKPKPPLTKEHRQRISEANKNRVFSEDHKKRLSVAGRRRVSCVECGMVSGPGNIGVHQKKSGHQGRTEA